MIPSEWRIQAVNATGVAFAATDTLQMDVQLWNMANSTAGEPTYAATASLFPSTAGNSLAAGGVVNSNVQSGNVYIGGEGLLYATVSTATPGGNINYYLQFFDSVTGAPNGGWPANGVGTFVGALVCTAVGAQGPNQVVF